MKRIEYLDFLRGVAIIVVVMGHVIQFNLRGDAADNCFNFIYSFHMGFFFFISGCTASLSLQKNTWNVVVPFVKKKAVQLLVPFFIWGGVITLTVSKLDVTAIPERLHQILLTPDRNAPWFIFTLFFIQIIYFVCCAISNQLNKKFLYPVLMLVSIPSVMLIQYLSHRYLGMQAAWVSKQYLLMFYAGVLCQKVEMNSKYVNPAIFVFFLIFAMVAPNFDFQMAGQQKEVIKLASSLSFSVCAYLLVKKSYFEIETKVKRITNHLGTHTLEIYLTQFCIVQICSGQWIDTGTVNGVPLFIVVLLLSILICLLVIKVSDVLKAIPAMSILLYGKSSNK